MKDADLRRLVGVARLGDSLKVLITVEVNACRTSRVIVGYKCRRGDLGSDREGEGFSKCLTIHKRAQILASSHGTGLLIQVKVAAAVEDDILSPLIDIGRRQTTIEQRVKARGDEIFSSPAVAEVPAG